MLHRYMCPLLPPPPPAPPALLPPPLPLLARTAGCNGFLNAFYASGEGTKALAPVWDGPPLEHVSYLSKSTAKAGCYCGGLPSTMRRVTQGKEAARGGPPARRAPPLVTPALFALAAGHLMQIQAQHTQYHKEMHTICIQYAVRRYCRRRPCRCRLPDVPPLPHPAAARNELQTTLLLAQVVLQN
jgi:hypothetical protein